MTTMNKKIAGLMALTMVATMSPMTAFAGYVTPTEQTYTGTGSVEDIIDKEIFTVELPTIPDTKLAFTMDPQGLISATGQSGYVSGETFYFTGSGKSAGSDNSTEEYEFKIGNAVDVDVSLTASVTDAEKLTFSTKDDWGVDGTGDDAIDNSKAHIYLGIITTVTDNGTAGSPKTTPITADGATVTEKLTKLADTNFETTGSAGNYTYEFNADSGTPNSFKLKLTGEANPAADWTADGMADIAPKISLVWNVKKHVDSYLDSTTMTADKYRFTIASGAPEVLSVKLDSDKVDDFDMIANDCCTLITNSDGTKTLDCLMYYGNVHSNATITITYVGGATETITIA